MTTWAMFDEAGTVTPETFDAVLAMRSDRFRADRPFLELRQTRWRALTAACSTCNGTEWVCEFHPDKPWGDQPNSGPNACHCGGAGKPCPECNPLSKEKRG